MTAVLLASNKDSILALVAPKVTPTYTVTPEPSKRDAKLIQDEAVKFIPAISEMPDGYLEDPASGPLPYANADGYSQIYKNPNFIQLDREVFVGYFTFVCEDSENASRILGEFDNELISQSNSELHEEDIIEKSIEVYDKSFEEELKKKEFPISQICYVKFPKYEKLYEIDKSFQIPVVNASDMKLFQSILKAILESEKQVSQPRKVTVPETTFRFLLCM